MKSRFRSKIVREAASIPWIRLVRIELSETVETLKLCGKSGNDDRMSMYNKTVLQHYRNPRNVGEIEDADGVGVYMSDFCGDITKFWIRVAEGKIVNAKYKTQGCAASIACGSVLTELVKNKTIEEALKITKDDIISALNGLPEQKIHCSVLADDSLKDAIRDHLSRNNLPVPQELVEKREKIRPLLEEMKQRGYILI